MAIVKWVGIALLIPLLLMVLLISLENWNWARDIVAQQVSERTHRKLTIHGDLSIDWSLTPNIRIEQIQFENAAWSERAHMLELAMLDLRIDLIELFKGHIIFSEIILTQPFVFLEKVADGRANWEFQIDRDQEKPMELPVIERLRIEEGRLIYRDLSKKTAINVNFGTTKGQTDGEEVTEIQAEGKLGGHPLTMDLKAGPLVALREAKVPYPLNLNLQAGKTVVSVNGTVTDPLQLKRIDLQFAMKGSDPDKFSPLLGIPIPSLPPYQLKGDLSHHEEIWQIENLNGRVGDSDFQGSISVNLGKKRPFIQGDLTSRKIDLDDLGTFIGFTPDTGPGETASPAQKKEAEKQAASPFLLPKKAIVFKELQNINANITLRGKHIQSKLPVDNLFVHVILDDGNLILAPLDFGVAKGNIESRLELDTRVQPAKSKVETKIHHVQLDEILRRFEIADESAGLIGGQGIYWFKGNSVAEMLASADGGLLMLMTGGKFDDLLTELAGLDIGEALVALFDEEDNTEINCAFVDLPIKGGIMNLETFVVDTKDTVFLGKGSIDFKKEQLDLIIDPQPKDVSLFSARAPLHIEGSLKKPTVIPGASAIVRGAVSLALLPSAPIVGLYSFLQKEQKERKEQKDNKQENIHCAGLVNAIDEARKKNE